MHRIAALVLAALLGTASLLTAVSPVRAGDCPGMDDYRYDHGDCTDASYDTSQIMRDMYHASDRLEEERDGRSRENREAAGGGFPAGPRGDRGMAARHAYAKTVYKLLHYDDDPAVTQLTIDGLVAKMPRSTRSADVRLVRNRLAAYRLLARSYGLPDGYLSAPAYVLLVRAYWSYDRESLPAGFSDPTYYALCGMLAPYAAKMTDAERQTTAERMAIAAAAIAVDGPTQPRSEMRSISAAVLKQFGLDPRRTRLDQILCKEPIYGRAMDCGELQWIASGGRMGRNPVTGQTATR